MTSSYVESTISSLISLARCRITIIKLAPLRPGISISLILVSLTSKSQFANLYFTSLMFLRPLELEKLTFSLWLWVNA